MQGCVRMGRSGVCSYCRIGVAPVGSSLCAACVKRGRGKKPAPGPRDHHQRADRNRGQCPYCSKVVRPKADGHLGGHKNKDGKHCVGSGGLPIGAKKTQGGGGSVRTVGGGLPGLGKRR